MVRRNPYFGAPCVTAPRGDQKKLLHDNAEKFYRLA